nr:ATP-dependent Lon protease [Tanacetum cinerariifolium]
DGPARRCVRQQTDATFDLPEAFRLKRLTGIQNEIADTSETRAAIYGSAHDGPARRCVRQQTDATFDLPEAFRLKRLTGIQNEIEDTLETRAAIYGSAHVLAAHGYGLKKVIMPERNKRDLVELPSAVLGSLENEWLLSIIQKEKALDVHRIASASAKRTTHPNVDPEVFQMRHQLGATNEGVSDEELLLNMLGLTNDGADDLHKLKPSSRKKVR